MIVYEIRRSRGKQPFYFRIVDEGNHKVLAHSETYFGKSHVRKAIRLIAGANIPIIHDLT